MKKQHLKRFAYGVSALTLGLSAVSIFPVGAYAEPVEVGSVGLVDEGPAEGMVGTDGDKGGNRGDVSRVRNNYERVQKVVNREEPFTVQAVKKASITVVDMSDSYYLMADVGDGESGGTTFVFGSVS
ncbi:hypothetical protein IJG27_02095 [Candidatus Saccharibacteria bacterium]|nr:hypothetical protein [Candidatus Saccharibacteria bacterium]